MNYKETYLKPEIAFLLKTHNFNIDKTRYMVNKSGTLIESTTELQKHYNHLELAYNPNAYEVIKYFKENKICININKTSDNMYEWIIKCGRTLIYSGETTNENIGHNLPELRQFFNKEEDAYYNAIIEVTNLFYKREY